MGVCHYVKYLPPADCGNLINIEFTQDNIQATAWHVGFKFYNGQPFKEYDDIKDLADDLNNLTDYLISVMNELNKTPL